MITLTATVRKSGDYWQAALLVPCGDRKPILYTSQDAFLTKATAQRQAEWWRYESLQVGQVTIA